MGAGGAQPGQFNNAEGIAVTVSAGVTTIYVADTNNNRIQIYTSGATPTWVTIGGVSTGTSLGQFNAPTGLALDNLGNLYVGEVGNARIQKLSGGTWSQLSIGAGSAAGYFSQPTGIAVDSGGNLFVADTGNKNVQKYSGGTWSILTAYPGSKPWGIAVDGSGNIYVSDYNGDYVYKLSGTTWSTFAGTGSSGSATGQFNLVAGICGDSSGNLFATDYNNNRVQEFNSAGNYENKVNNLSVSGPFAVASDNLGSVYALDAVLNFIAVNSYVP